MRLLQSRVASDPVQVPTRLPPGSSSGPYSPGPGRVAFGFMVGYFLIFLF